MAEYIITLKNKRRFVKFKTGHFLEINSGDAVCFDEDGYAIKVLSANTSKLKSNYEDKTTDPIPDLKPTTKFTNNTITEQFAHMAEELGEIAKNIRILNKTRSSYDWVNTIHDSINSIMLAEEVADLQLSCETMLKILEKYTRKSSKEIRQKVYEKNELRNYYKPFCKG